MNSNPLELALVFQKLGELEHINANYDGAISDFKACLKIRMGNLPVGDRRIAET